jgi:hypothetical protein
MRFANETPAIRTRRPARAPFFLAAVVTIALQLFSPARAAADSTNDAFVVGDLFEARRFEANVSGGALFSPIGAPAYRPVINYTIATLQLGYMLSDVKGPGILRGNFEVAGDAFASKIFVGPGSYIAGGTVWIRYNFVPAGWRIIPYLEGGAGLTTTDIDRAYVGQPFNFNLDIAAGLRFFVARNWSIDLICQYQHISNADTGKKNIGINSYGPVLGVSYFF